MYSVLQQPQLYVAVMEVTENNDKLEGAEGSVQKEPESTPGSFLYSNPQHAQELLKGLDRVRDSKEFTDITLHVGDQQFECHKLVLSLATPYFRTMFTSGMKEATAAEVTMHGVEPDIFAKIVDFIYRGKVLIEESNFQKLLEAGNMLQLETLCDGCAKYLEKELATHNCLGFWLFGQRINNDSLVKTSLAYAREHFAEVQQKEEFLNLSTTELCQYIGDDSLNVKSEDEVGQAVMAWFLRDPSTRTAAMKDVLLYLRLNHLSMEYLRLHMMRCGQLRQSVECMQLVDRAMDMQLFPEVGVPEMHSNYPRLSMGMEQWLLVFARPLPKNPGLNSANAISRYHYYHEEYDDYRQYGMDSRVIHGVSLQRTPSEAAIIGSAGKWVTNERVATCTVRNDVYMAGAGARCNEIWRYDGQRGDWQKCASLSKLCLPSCIVPLGEKIYLFGGIHIEERGNTTRIPLPEFEEYCIRTNRCRVVGQLQLAVQDMGCAAHAGIIYILGGRDATCSPTSTMQLVHISKNPPVVELEALWSLPHAPKCVGVVHHEDSLLVVTDQAVLSHSITKKVWQILSTHGAGNHTFACCLDNHYLYVAGGELPTSESPPQAEKTKDETPKDETTKLETVVVRSRQKLKRYFEDYDDDGELYGYYDDDGGDDAAAAADDDDDDDYLGEGNVLQAQGVFNRQNKPAGKGQMPKSKVFRISLESISSASAEGAAAKEQCRLVWENYATLPRALMVYSTCSVARPIPVTKEKQNSKKEYVYLMG